MVTAAATTATHIHTVVTRSVRGTRGLFIEPPPPEDAGTAEEVTPSIILLTRGSTPGESSPSASCPEQGHADDGVPPRRHG